MIPRTDTISGTWLAYSLRCPDGDCAYSGNSTILASYPPGTANFVGLGHPKPHFRSLLRIELQFASLVIGLDDKWGTDERTKTSEICGKITAGRLPEWKGSHCPLCLKWLHNGIAEQDPFSWQARESPKIFVQDVQRIPDKDQISIMLASDTMPDLWLRLVVPAWVLPPPPVAS